MQVRVVSPDEFVDEKERQRLGLGQSSSNARAVAGVAGGESASTSASASVDIPVHDSWRDLTYREWSEFVNFSICEG